MARNGTVSEGLTPKEGEFLACLLMEPTVTAAAEKAGGGKRAAVRYLENPLFQEAYRKARRQTVNHAIVAVQASASKAVETLTGIMEDTGAPAPSRVSAARILLETAVKAVELEDVIERLERLELEQELSKG